MATSKGRKSEGSKGAGKQAAPERDRQSSLLFDDWTAPPDVDDVDHSAARAAEASVAAAAAVDEFERSVADAEIEDGATTAAGGHAVSFAATPGSKGILKKANEAVVMTPVNGDLIFLTRKLFNVLLYHAQQQGLKELDRYGIPVKLLKRDAGFNSKDLETLKDRARNLIRTTIEWGWAGGLDDPAAPNKVWNVTAMMADLVIERHPETRELWVYWSYSSVLKKQLLESGEYTKLSLAIMAGLRSLPALALYEIAARYETNPSGVSRKVPWERWVTILRGKPISEYPTLDYRRFNLETLKKAKEQVNTGQKDFEVDWREFKVGRKVTHLQLVLRSLRAPGKSGPDMELRAQMDLDLFNRMLLMGIGQYAADAIYGSCDERVLRDAIEKTETRMASKKLGKVVSPEAYLKDRIRALAEHVENGEALPSPSPAPQAAGTTSAAAIDKKPATGQSMDEHLARVRDDYVSFHITRAKAMFAEAMSPQQDEWIETFRVTRLPSGGDRLKEAFAQKGLKAPMVAGVFYRWLSEVTWNPNPSQVELLEFALSRGTVKFG